MTRILALIFFFQISLGFSQCPEGDVILSSQKEIEEFFTNYGNCKNINSSLILLSGISTDATAGLTTTTITDLSAFKYIETIRGNLKITVDLESLNSFDSLREVKGDIEVTNSANLKEINDFKNLTKARQIIIALNPLLEKISGFNRLENLTLGLELGYSPRLKAISGFDNLKVLEGQLDISNNPELLTIPTFNNLTTINNDFNITSNPKLTEIIGFNELTYVGNDFDIEDAKIIRGFDKLQIIERFFEIRGKGVEEIPNFKRLESIGASFRIINTNISKINAFDNLKKVGEKYFLEDWFILSNNEALTEITGFATFAKVEGDLKVENNVLLSDCAWLCNLFNNGKITGTVTIQNNIGNCINAAKIIEICDPDFDDDTIADVVDLDDDNDGILDLVEGNGDKDSDGFIDAKDLDSDGDGCFDVVEAGFEDPNNDGVLGDLPDTVNPDGTISNESTGYTTPADKNNNAIYDFQENTLLNPGANTIVDLCRNDDEFDLLTFLNGNPDPGGTWTPALSGGNGIFDSKVDKAGVYKYTHKDAICGESSAELLINLSSRISAGEDTDVFICEKVGRINLFEKLKGNPTPGGVWSPELSSGNHMYDPRFDKESSYSYIVSDENCGSLIARINFIKSSLPNSGTDNTLKICEFSSEVNLLEVLGGEPDTGGSWFPDLPNGVFNPTIHSSGNYTYSIDKGECGVASSTVNVEVLKDSELDNVSLRINDFSSENNNVVVFVNSNREYEYSKDGFNYQTSNVLNNVPGGNQTIYVRGRDGCEFFSKEIYIRTFPGFFTPNNDGKNDFWRLKHFPNVNYTIYIYSRFGKLIKEFKNASGFWDGSYNGKKLQSSDYWFRLVTEKGEVLTGNFSLLRK